MTWVLIIGVAWLAVSVVAALLIAGTVRLAEQRRRRSGRTAQGNFVVDLHAADGAEGTAPAPDARPAEPHRSVPGARKPIVRDCIAPSERSTIARNTGTR